MKTSEVLRLAKKLLWNGKEFRPWDRWTYVCVAVDETGTTYGAPYKDRIRVKRMISKRLKPFYDVEDWLADRVSPTTIYRASEYKIQQYRHRWVNAMIAEFKAKGD